MPVDQLAESLMILLEAARHKLRIVRAFSLFQWHRPLRSLWLVATTRSALAYLIH